MSRRVILPFALAVATCVAPETSAQTSRTVLAEGSCVGHDTTGKKEVVKPVVYWCWVRQSGTPQPLGGTALARSGSYRCLLDALAVSVPVGSISVEITARAPSPWREIREPYVVCYSNETVPCLRRDVPFVRAARGERLSWFHAWPGLGEPRESRLRVGIAAGLGEPTGGAATGYDPGFNVTLLGGRAIDPYRMVRLNLSYRRARTPPMPDSQGVSARDLIALGGGGSMVQSLGRPYLLLGFDVSRYQTTVTSVDSAGVGSTQRFAAFAWGPLAGLGIGHQVRQADIFIEAIAHRLFVEEGVFASSSTRVWLVQLVVGVSP
jgi:hypothetical protein